MLTDSMSDALTMPFPSIVRLHSISIFLLLHQLAVLGTWHGFLLCQNPRSCLRPFASISNATMDISPPYIETQKDGDRLAIVCPLLGMLLDFLLRNNAACQVVAVDS